MEETSCKCDGSMGTLRAYTVRGARMPESKKSPSFWVSWASGALAHWAKALGPAYMCMAFNAVTPQTVLEVFEAWSSMSWVEVDLVS